MFDSEFLPVFQIGFGLANVLERERVSEGGGHNQRKDREGPCRPASQGRGPPPSPFSPPFQEASVGDAAQR